MKNSHSLAEILNNLNPSQREAVLHDHAKSGPLLILAGAGSGKTSVLTRRIQWLISQDSIQPANILGLTFTAKAAKEMHERVGHAEVRLCTFHSLALSLIREHWRLLGFSVRPVPCENATRHWEEQVMRAGLKRGALERDLLFAPTLSRQIRKALPALQVTCLENGNVVFEDLIWLAIRLLRDFAEVRTAVRARFTHVLVDEYQDINSSQYQFVRLVIGPRPNLFVVGDDDQAIYGFRGADIGNILRFRKDYPGCRVVKLEWNYRSTSAILEVANRIFADKALLLRKQLRPGSNRKDALFAENLRVENWVSQNPREEVDRMLTLMRELREKHGLAWSSFAILVRYNRQKEWYSLALKESLIPVGGSAGVQLETVHGAKGLQYPVVFYCGLAEGITPGRVEGSRRQKSAQRSEEKRLFYVGVTRAEVRLYLLFCGQRHWQGNLCKLQASPYLGYSMEPLEPQTLWIYKVPMLMKIVIMTRILAFMAWAMVEYVFDVLIRRQPAPAWMDRKLNAWARFCLQVQTVDIRVKGHSHLALVDWNRPVFVVSNHQSYMDIPTVLVALNHKLGFVAKYELGRIPLLGYWMKQIGCLLIKRGKAGVGDQVNEAIRQMPHAPNLVIFPEGTRSRDGSLSPFKSGAFRMVTDHKGILIPLVIRGTRPVWENRSLEGSKRYPVDCEILEPVDCSDPISHKELMNQVRERMEVALGHKEATY